MPRRSHSRIRYAVVGQGHIAQVAVLPAFRNARRNSELAGLVSGDRGKLAKLARRHRVPHAWTYAEYDQCLCSGAIDAVYLALPNDQHRDYAVRAAAAGIHVLCEKPMATRERDCGAMIRAAERARVKLMIAYRLHFDPANLHAIEIVRSGRLGDVRIFDSLFTHDVTDEDNIRLERAKGGGTLFDIGVYCINAARYLFRAEPVEGAAMAARGKQARFRDVDEMTTATLRFPGDRLATFTCSFGAARHSSYRVVGTEGQIELEPAYSYSEPSTLRVTIGGRTRERRFVKHDQFAPELLHFSDCILEDRSVEPSGAEGLADVRIVLALQRAARDRRAVMLEPVDRRRRPDARLEMRKPPVREPELVEAEAPHAET